VLPAEGKSWWREGEVALLLLLVFGAYFVRAGALSVRGEESRRAQVAFELLVHNDWVVPREQGDPFLSRPPLQNWLIAASTELLGRRDAWAIRLPSLAAVLATTLLIYGYARRFLPRLGALAAGVAFATFGEMFTTGAQAETEAVFICLVGAALLVWHRGWLDGWPEALTWGLGYGLAALGALTKGPQAPTYFVASSWGYLLLTGQGRRLLRKGHLLGAAAGLFLLAAWQVPFFLEVGWRDTYAMWSGDSSLRFSQASWASVREHLVTYPFEILGCTLPWSPLLLGFISPAFCRRVRATAPQAGFAALSLAIAFPTCWIPPGGQSRYFAPLYPCLAVLVGVVVQRCADADVAGRLAAGWRRYLALLAGLMAATAGAVMFLSLAAVNPRLARWAEPLPAALAYAVLALGLAVVLWRVRAAGSPARVRWAVLTLAGFMIAACTGYVTDVRERRSEDVQGAVAALKERLPPGQRLVSLGVPINSNFAYFFGTYIEPRPWPKAADSLAPGETYFCFDRDQPGRPTLPFAWEEIGAVPMRRYHDQDDDHSAVVVGRRLEGRPAGLGAAPPADPCASRGRAPI
jgi:4-amino-4-deoxy-L-arabinose transferase-like glycosyltransferase